MKPRRVLVACEFSGIVSSAFRKLGHDAWSCDILPSEQEGGGHLQCDIREVLDQHWDLIIAHPPCTYLTNAGVRWLHTEEGRYDLMVEGAEFFNLFQGHRCKKIVIENPIPHKYALEFIGRKYDQIIQPWQFGHKEMKATCLWLKGLPPLVPTDIVGPPPKDKKERAKWQKVHRASPGPDRWKERSRTYQGIANALADQYGSLN